MAGIIIIIIEIVIISFSHIESSYRFLLRLHLLSGF